MEIKKIIFYLFLFCIASNVSFSQDIDANYFIDTEDGEPRFKQRLSWRGDGNAYRYEIIIEKNEDNSFVSHAKETTSSRFIIVSLPHGDYRFRVIPYDIFEIAGLTSEWRRIEVRQARQPRLYEITPEIVLGEDGTPFGFTVHVTGDSIDPDAEFFLHYPDNTRTVLDTIEYDDEGNVFLFVDTTDLEEGEYDVIVKNPGGLEANIGRKVVNNVIEQIADIRERITSTEDRVSEIEEDLLEEIAEHEDQKQDRTFYLRAGIAWIPIIYLYGSNDISLTNISFNMDFIFKLPHEIYFGPEIVFGNYYQLDEFIIGLNLLAEKWALNEKIIIGFRAGTGIIISSGIEIVSIVLNMGASISWRFVNNFLLDTGVNYMHLFGENESGCLNPFIGLKFQL